MVYHSSIEKGLRRKGIPDQVRGTIMEMYEDARTIGGKVTRKVRLMLR